MYHRVILCHYDIGKYVFFDQIKLLPSTSFCFLHFKVFFFTSCNVWEKAELELKGKKNVSHKRCQVVPKF